MQINIDEIQAQVRKQANLLRHRAGYKVLKIAIAVPWFGAEIHGGAETHAFEMARALAKHCHVTVFTTTQHHANSAKKHREGEEQDGNLRIQRFDAAPEPADLQAACIRISRAKDPRDISQEDAKIFSQNTYSPDMMRWLWCREKDYHAIIFLPYLYSPALLGVSMLKKKAWLMPCLHKEPWALLPQVADAFANAGKVLFLSEGERDVAVEMFGPGILEKSLIVGAGIAHIQHFNDSPQKGAYALVLGRKNAHKGTTRIMQGWREFRRRYPNSKLKLVFAGHGEIPGNLAGAIDLGPVREEVKQALLSGCKMLLSPSTSESYSRVIYEAWLHQKPVAVRSDCKATQLAVSASGGGWTAESAIEWAELFYRLSKARKPALDRMGGKGRAYAETYACWGRTVNLILDEAMKSTQVDNPTEKKLGSELQVGEDVKGKSQALAFGG